MSSPREFFTVEPASEARLHARPTSGPRPAAESGVRTITLTNGREGLLYVPQSYRADRPSPLLVSLHGAGSTAQRGLDRVFPLADEFDTIVFAPQSGGPTWDILVGGYGPDVAAIDAALAEIFARYAVNAERLALGGFSDGASYALSLGLSNGDIFTHIIAFSPGFADPSGLLGNPALFFSHGTLDTVLPIDQASRLAVRLLSQAGYEIRYVEFDGPHTVPDEVLRVAYLWFLESAGPGGASTQA